MTRVLHANWCNGELHLWCEPAPGMPVATDSADAHFDPAPYLPAWLHEQASAWTRGSIKVMLPAQAGASVPSPAMAHFLGIATRAEEGAEPPVLHGVEVPSVSIPAAFAVTVLECIAEGTDGSGLEVEDAFLPGASFDYYAQAARLVRFLLAQQRFVPMLIQNLSGDVSASWRPWMSDEATSARVQALVDAMPPSARAGVDAMNHDAWAITEEFICSCADALCRDALIRASFVDSIQERDPATDPHVAWLTGLLASETRVPATVGQRPELTKRIRTWIGLLEERGVSSAWRLLLRLDEPVESAATDLQAAWRLRFLLQSVERPDLVVDAEDLWLLSTDSVTIHGRRLDRPQELLLAEIARAARLYARLEAALDESEPRLLTLDTRRAYEFLREVRPILVEQGFGVAVPPWWDSPMARLGAKLRLDAGDLDPFSPVSSASAAAKSSVGLGALVRYQWEISVGDATLSLTEFEQLIARKSPLVRINGRWVEVRPEDVETAIRFIRENPGGDIGLGEAIRMAYAVDPRDTGLPVVGLEATGWLGSFLRGEAETRTLDFVQAPPTFHGQLRPYQVRGLSWLVFQERLGFGACLADDMGLGKTVQLLALLAFERYGVERGHLAFPAPTLLLVPMSVVGNWVHETRRFCPDLRVLVHHGPERSQGEDLIKRVQESDLVITTYALATRDREMLAGAGWHRIVLDEAQYIKNPIAKQSQAARSFEAPHRVALTGTPVENRLAELWSIMDFLNPKYLGTSGSFRQRFAVPIERYRDKLRADQLRALIRPFLLRRLKTDPFVVADLPEKVETKEFSHLTGEQASLYDSCVKRMLSDVDHAEGMQRRGLVLAGLVKLKQICNHPALAQAEGSGISTPPDPARSGKCVRLLEMLEQVLAEGDKALIFTQFRTMGDLLAPMLRHHLGADVLFLHGGTTQPQRQQIIDTFQRAGGPPILILSLKAGGVGLNLTAATHVFHFDRWWNPAVENQATDRAYRIGQTRTVQVHKFVVGGTLEERIDQMIESKIELAENIIGAGEAWLSELSTDQLRDILTLRNDAVEDEV